MVANDMSSLINKIEKRLGLLLLTPHLPKPLAKPAWEKVIKEDSMVTFSRYFYRKIPFPVNDASCHKRRGRDGVVTYYINDEYLDGLTLLGVMDIDWNDFNTDNLSLNQVGGYGYYMPEYIGCPSCTFETIMATQMTADMSSLTNRGVYLEFMEPNAFKVTGAAGVNVNLNNFVINLLVAHQNLQTISPTKMETFEALAQADIANFLQKNLRYMDGLEIPYLSIDLKLSELESEASKRENIIEDLKNSYVSAANDNIPYMMTI